MSAFPCANKMPCACTNDPIGNLTAEGYDQRLYIRNVYPAYSGVGGSQWDGSCCEFVCTSTVSQEMADLCAYNTAFWGSMSGCMPVGTPDGSVECVTPDTYDGSGCPTCVPVIGSLFWNTFQSCSHECANGTIFYAGVTAGSVSASSQLLANRMAESLACRLARTRTVCLSYTGNQGCTNFAFNCLITATGATTAPTWYWGSLPAGLSFEYWPASGLAQNQARVTGIPTSNGTFTFQVGALTATGLAVRQVTVRFLEITSPLLLDDGTVSSEYSYQFTVAGGSGNYAFSVTDGILPDGLSLSADGWLTGTPTTAGSYNFTVEACDSNF